MLSYMIMLPEIKESIAFSFVNCFKMCELPQVKHLELCDLFSVTVILHAFVIHIVAE